eukprot:2943252-Prymnesium_polylepis.1
MFLLRFGAAPRQLLSQPNPNDVCELVVPTGIKPPPSEADRLRAICEVFGFDGWQTGGGFPLSSVELAQARQGGDPSGLVSFRQFCTLMTADEELLGSFLATRGRLRGNVDLGKVWAQMERIFEHNLSSLPAPDEPEPSINCIAAKERQDMEAWRQLLQARYGSLAA